MTMLFSVSKMALLAGLGALFVTGAEAQAQTPTDQAQAPDTTAPPPSESGNAETAAERNTGLSTIVVTARRREERLQDVPVAVTAIGAEKFEQMFANSFADIDQVAPNVSFDLALASTIHTPAGSIRGIGTVEIDSATDPAVPIVVDGFTYARLAGSMLDLFDVERIEVLRGPQGALFGMNTIAGAINIVSQKPTGEFGGKAQVRIGNFGRLDMRATLDFPIAPGLLAGKVSVLSTKSNGYWHNLATNESVGGDNTFAIRPKLLFTPSDELEMVLTGEVIRTRPGIIPFSNFSTSDQVLAQIGFQGTDSNGKPLEDQPFTVFNNDFRTKNFFDAKLLILNASYDAGWGEFTSITGYRKTKENLGADVDATSLILLHTPRATDAEQFSQELRLLSSVTDRMDVLIGGYYNWWKYFTLDDWAFGENIFLTGDTAQRSETKALFGQVNYKLTDRLRVTAGGRYTWINKTFDRMPVGVPDRVNASAKWSSFSPEVSVDYKFSGGNMVYAKWARGFRSGGFNGRANQLLTIGPYGEEIADSYEVGLKSELLDRRLRLNIAGFYINYRDLQTTQVVPSPGGAGFDTLIVNAGKVGIKGIEVEMTAIITPQLRLSASVGYLDAKYKEFMSDLNNDGVSEDASFLELPRAPEWSVNISPSYETDVGDFGSLLFNVNYSFTPQIQTNVQNIVPREATHLVDASITLTTADERFSFAIWGRNLTDQLYVGQAFPVGDITNFGRFAEPRTYGAEFTVRF
ncbi:TonB-dependent receptor [Rhizorhapis sp. SPR117]|uniref:TonB-dependent receptor n=1 Tax=Rhizorhapis sp. SPR117 TaxID=2912611 RepID=UPI001F21C3CC|nr:TonB-dependent receptor [Rhizorhapis sp. SPR117]